MVGKQAAIQKRSGGRESWRLAGLCKVEKRNDTLASTLTKAKAETPGDTMSNMEGKELVNSSGDTLAKV